MLGYLKIDHIEKEFPETEIASAEEAAKAVQADEAITHVVVVHHETTAGQINPVEEIGCAIKAVRPSLCFAVDSMSGFGSLPINLETAKIDYLVYCHGRIYCVDCSLWL